MRGLLERLSKRYRRIGFRRGLSEGSDFWLAVGALSLLVRVLTKQDKPSTVTEKLKVGESITVTHLPAPPGKRAARRSAATAPTEA